MEVAEIFTDAFTRINEAVHAIVEGLDEAQLTFRADAEANSIAWLLWHLTRVQDDHISEVAGVEQAWTEGGWADRFALPFDRDATGWGHKPDEVGQVRASGDLLSAYSDAVTARTTGYLKNLSAPDLDRVVDRRWDPPVTLGVRLVSIVEDDFQHIGQAGFVRGLVQRQAKSS
jgi:uncharacterized damage-inducible protein DinB